MGVSKSISDLVCESYIRQSGRVIDYFAIKAVIKLCVTNIMHIFVGLFYICWNWKASFDL